MVGSLGRPVLTKPMAHQEQGIEFAAERPEYLANGCEQGTGKTWMILADAERQFLAGRISALLVVAPKGVHVNWVRREVPKHLEVPTRAMHWVSGAGIKYTRKLESLMKSSERLTIFTINIDALNTKRGYDYAEQFLMTHRCMMVIDESQRIKNPYAKRTERAISLGKLAVSRRISSGTLVSNSPLDLFSQFDFLEPGLLGTTSYRAFTAQYAELLPPSHSLMKGIRGNPQIVKKDGSGRPIYKNLERLQNLIAPHTFRVLKSDCLDLPEKIYQTHYFDLDNAQMRLYEQVKADMRFEREDGDIDAFTALTLINKLRQITSGFIMVDGTATGLDRGEPRMQALEDVLEDLDGPVIIWASFREEIRRIAARLAPMGVVEYHGGIGPKEREEAIERFQEGSARVFVAHPAAGGTGLTLTAAQTVIYYSCSFSLEERLQSEDRAHRIGTKHHVVYIDLVARGTVDEKIAAALQAKAGVAAEILNGL